MACLPVNRGDLWRHWYQPSIRFLLHLLFRAVTYRSGWSFVHCHLVPDYNGDRQVCLGYPAG